MSDHSPIAVRVQFQVSDDCLQNVGLGLVWLVPCVRSLTYSSEHSPIVVKVQFQVSDDCLQNVGLGVVWLVPCVRSLTYSTEGSVLGFG